MKRTYVVCYNDYDGQDTKGVFTESKMAVACLMKTDDSDCYYIEVWLNEKLLKTVSRKELVKANELILL